MSDGARGLFVGIDIGGTLVKGGALRADELGELDPRELDRRTRTIDTEVERGAEDLLDRIAAFVLELGPAERVGIGCPGVLDLDEGRLLRSANLAPMGGIALALELATRLELAVEDVRIDNDANLATYGEQWLGAGRDTPDLVMLTLGTGIGSGIVLDGRLFRGQTGKGAEVGHMIVRSLPAGEAEDPDLRCGCGSYGCLERLASATAAKRRASAAGLGTDLGALAQRAREGAGPERELFEAIGRDLGAGMLAVTSLLDVTCFVIGGGFGRALDVLAPGVEQIFEHSDYGHDRLRLLPAELGAAAGWVGAARLALEADSGTAS